MPPCRQTSVAPRSHASTTRRTISSCGTRYGGAAQVRGELPLRERAEAAAEVADVRVLDVARDDVADVVAVDLAPEQVGGARRRARAPRRAPRKSRTISSSPSSSRESTRQRVARTTNGTSTGSPGAQPSSRASPSESASAQRVRQHARVDPVGVEPARDRRCSRGASSSPRLARRVAQQLDRGPRRLRVDVVDRDRRDAAPVVDAGVEQRREVLASGSAAPGGATSGGSRSRAAAIVQRCSVERRLRRVRHLRARLGAEVLDDHLLHVAVPRVRGARSRAAPRAAPRASRRSRSGSRS